MNRNAVMMHVIAMIVMDILIMSNVRGWKAQVTVIGAQALAVVFGVHYGRRMTLLNLQRKLDAIPE